MLRYRKKAEKDEAYQATIMALAEPIEHCIKQNNALDIYSDYFPGKSITAEIEPPTATTINVLR